MKNYINVPELKIQDMEIATIQELVKTELESIHIPIPYFEKHPKMQKILDSATSMEALRIVLPRFQKLYDQMVISIEKPNDDVDDTRFIALHITHEDSDAYGCTVTTTVLTALQNATEEAIGGKRDRYQEIIVSSPAYLSEAIVLCSALVYRVIFRSFPYRLVISDIGVSMEIVDIVRLVFEYPIMKPVTLYSGFMITSDNHMAFLYADHHKTSPLMGKELNPEGNEVWFTDRMFVLAQTAGEFKKKYPTIVRAQRASNIDAVLNTEDLRISAALLVWVMFRCSISEICANLKHPILWNSVKKEDRLFADEVDERKSSTADSLNYLLLQMDALIQDISQWDTFEWRDHPQFNHGTEKVLVYAEAFFDRETAYEKCRTYVGDFIQAILWNCKISRTSIYTNDVEPDVLYPELIENASSFGKMLIENLVQKAIGQMKVIGKEVLIKELPEDLYQDERIAEEIARFGTGEDTSYPERFVVTTFPEVGNASIFIYELGKILREKGETTTVIAFSFTSDVISLRTSESGIDLSKVAKLFNGGGHPQASGFRNKNVSDRLKEIYLKKE